MVNDIICIRGKHYRIDLAKRRLINLDNPKDCREMVGESYEYFKELMRSRGQSIILQS